LIDSIRFNVWLVSGYAQVFILSVVTDPLPSRAADSASPDLHGGTKKVSHYQIIKMSCYRITSY